MANNHDPGSARWRFADRETGGSARCARVRDRLVSETVWGRRPFGAGDRLGPEKGSRSGPKSSYQSSSIELDRILPSMSSSRVP